MKSFYDFNRDNPQERQERNKLYPELAKFHIALREELSEEEYQQFFKSEQESFKSTLLQNPTNTRQWISV